jgi:hypothetical protein
MRGHERPKSFRSCKLIVTYPPSLYLQNVLNQRLTEPSRARFLVKSATQRSCKNKILRPWNLRLILTVSVFADIAASGVLLPGTIVEQIAAVREVR